MKTFKILLDVRNVLAEFDGQVKRVGFFVTKIVDAPNLNLAFEAAKHEVLHSAEAQRIFKNASDDPPQVVLEEHEAVNRATGEDVETGFLFYEE